MVPWFDENNDETPGIFPKELLVGLDETENETGLWLLNLMPLKMFTQMIDFLNLSSLMKEVESHLHLPHIFEITGKANNIFTDQEWRWLRTENKYKGKLRNASPTHWVNYDWSGALQALRLRKEFRLAEIYQ